MKILAIDTSSKNATVAITENEEKVIELNNSDEKTHSQKLMPMIDEAFQKTNLSLNDINLIACCLGPGSFTGVRIGIATAKAFCDSKNIPAVGVNSLEALAYNLNAEGYACSMIDAGHGNTYAGIFKLERDNSDRLQIVQSDLTFLNLKDENGNLSEKKLVTFLEKNIKLENDKNSDENREIEQNQKINSKNEIYFVGDATIVYEELLKKLKENAQNLCDIKIANCSQNTSSGITIAKLGYTKYKNGQYGDSSVLSPVYLRKSQAELALEMKK